ncbi:MAG: hypothetical protein KAR35_05370, partial [Candidatus Heimdallarchaeota archaeon]|nr:hypothetical protein [Candidatus Heimdallarchaeota archaeon]MCK5048787.1 hypothetical protein [Candidatus Heimdallarchaeota archaeon]
MVDGMIEDTFLLTLIFQAILIAFIEILFLYKAFRLKLNGLSWFYAIFGVSLIRVILEILAHIYITVPKNYEIKNYKYVHFVFYAISLLILFYFVELLEHPSPRFFPSSIILVLFGSFIGSFAFFLFVDTNLEFHRDLRHTFDIMQIIILWKASLVYYRIHKRALYDSLRSVTLWFFISVFAMAIFSVIEFMEHYYSFLSPASTIFSIFFLVLACLFLYKPYYVYLVPYKIHRLMLYDENSFLIYSCRLERTKEMDEIEVIFGGAMNNLEKSIQTI